MTLRIAHPSTEGVYQASKWLKYQVLLDSDEMKNLISSLGSFWIFPVTGVVDGKPISHEFFIEEYGRWIEGLKQGEIPSAQALRRLMACVWTSDLDALWLQEVSSGRYITKVSKPVIQVQTHFFSYSDVDGVFRPMSMGLDSIFWGLQWSFPQIYQDPKTMELCEAEENVLFRKLRYSIREMSRSTPFIVGDKKINATIRLGKQCFPWIHKHPQLDLRGIHVSTAG